MGGIVELFVFSSRNLTNIWAGIGARLWAVSQRHESGMKELVTKSKRMQIGSIGLLYCSEVQALTTSFIVYSTPDDQKVIENVWPEAWVMPFRIHPLGTPQKQLHKSDAVKLLPVFRAKNSTNIGHVFAIQPTTVFVPSEVSTEDWRIIVERLAE
jgi:hypothetical protein